MKPASPRPFAFDSRSVMLFAALTMGGAASVRAQTPAAPPAARTQVSPFATGTAAPAPSPADAAFDPGATTVVVDHPAPVGCATCGTTLAPDAAACTTCGRPRG